MRLAPCKNYILRHKNFFLFYLFFFFFFKYTTTFLLLRLIFRIFTKLSKIHKLERENNISLPRTRHALVYVYLLCYQEYLKRFWTVVITSPWSTDDKSPGSERWNSPTSSPWMSCLIYTIFYPVCLAVTHVNIIRCRCVRESLSLYTTLNQALSSPMPWGELVQFFFKLWLLFVL